MIVFIGFMLIILLVIIHEAGHYLAAKRSGVEVEEFGIGFPPKATSLGVRKGTEFTLNWLPLGGFVKLKGEHDSDTIPGSFGAARLRDKVKIMLAGVAMNFITAFLLFTIIALIGMPQLIDNQFTVASDTAVTRQDILANFIEEGSPAEEAGLKLNDSIKTIQSADDQCQLEICRYELTETEDLRTATNSLAGEEVVLDVIRGNQQLSLTSTLRSEDEVVASRETNSPVGYLGVVPAKYSAQRSTWSAPIVAAGTTVQFTQATLGGLGSIVTGLAQGDTDAATEQVSGVLGVGFIFDSASFLGPVFMLMIVAVISLSLAIMNVLPIPALDGGRLFVTLVFRGLNKPLTKETEERIHGTGFAVLMVLFVLITIVDVQRFIL